MTRSAEGSCYYVYFAKSEKIIRHVGGRRDVLLSASKGTTFWSSSMSKSITLQRERTKTLIAFVMQDAKGKVLAAKNPRWFQKFRVWLYFTTFWALKKQLFNLLLQKSRERKFLGNDRLTYKKILRCSYLNFQKILLSTKCVQRSPSWPRCDSFVLFHKLTSIRLLPVSKTWFSRLNWHFEWIDIVNPNFQQAFIH